MGMYICEHQLMTVLAWAMAVCIGWSVLSFLFSPLVAGCVGEEC